MDSSVADPHRSEDVIGKPPESADSGDAWERDELVRHYDIQTAINAILRASLEDVPLPRLLQSALDQVLAIPWLSSEDDPAVLTLAAHSGLPARLVDLCANVPFGTCLCGKAASSRETQFVDRVDDRHEMAPHGFRAHGHYCVPITYEERTLGVINIYVREGHTRAPLEEEFLQAVADALAGALRRRHSEDELRSGLQELRATLEGAVHALASTTERRDPYTSAHQERVTRLACAIGREMRLPADKVEGIRVAGTLHDIGKICVPTDILNKPGHLTEMEMAFIRAHPEIGHDLARRIPFPWPIAQIILQHHERVDGSGYPHSLMGEDLLVEARVLAVADVVEALASHRPYRPALGIDKALEEVHGSRDVRYDGWAVDACVNLIRKEGYEIG